MFSSTILDVAVGLVFVFFVVSLAASAILEAFAGILTWRSGTLLKNVKALLNDENFTGLAAQLYQHALVNPRSAGLSATDPSWRWLPVTMTLQGDEKKLRPDAPAYIDPKQFANALLDILNTGSPTAPKVGVAAAAPAGHPGTMVTGNQASIDSAIDHVVPVAVNPQINALLKGMARRANHDLTRMRDDLATWFDNAMDRVSGAYKRWTQLWQFVIALLLAIVMNVSALHVASQLWKAPNAAKSIEKAIENNAKLKANEKPVEAIRQLDDLSLPIGWSHYNLPKPTAQQTEGSAPTTPPAGADKQQTASDKKTAASPVWPDDYCEMILGWLITAIAAIFGAPFWFDLLQKMIRLKGAGPSPKEKENKTAAAG